MWDLPSTFAGIDCVSNFLVSYLKRWNGLDYKQEILNLCEWFVFDSKLNLINDFLKPLHELLLTAEVDDKRLYIEMYGKLYVNLVRKFHIQVVKCFYFLLQDYTKYYEALYYVMRNHYNRSNFSESGNRWKYPY
jgi:hypothetical protein